MIISRLGASLDNLFSTYFIVNDSLKPKNHIAWIAEITEIYLHITGGPRIVQILCFLGILLLQNCTKWADISTKYHIFANCFFPWILSPLQNFHNNCSIYEVKNCNNAETKWKFPHFPLSKKNSFRGNFLRKYGM